VADLNVFTPAVNTLSSIVQGDQQQVLDAVSTMFDGYMSGTYTPPFIGPTFPLDLRMRVCHVAHYLLLFGRRGANPMAPADDTWRKLYEDGIAWAKDVGKGVVTLVGLVDSSTDQIEGVPTIVTASQRGWTNRGNTARDPGNPFEADIYPSSAAGFGSDSGDE
jgi:phage gp36-like protein